MNLRREWLLSLAALAIVNLALAFGSIGLFARLRPAVGKLLVENVTTITDVQQVLSELAKSNAGPIEDSAQARIRTALTRARANITEPDEGPILDAVDAELPNALQDKGPSRDALVQHLNGLIQVNLSAMARANEEATRLSHAGAWTVVFLGFLSFLLTVLVADRIRSRFLSPWTETHEVLQAHEHGDLLRRCKTLDTAPEMQLTMQSINRLMDLQLRSSSKLEDVNATFDARAIEILLQNSRGIAVIRGDGTLVRATNDVLDLLASDRGLELKRAMSRRQPHPGVTYSDLPDHLGWLVLVNDSNTTPSGRIDTAQRVGNEAADL